MAIPFGTPQWAAAMQDEVNCSSEYRNAAAKWGIGFNGNVLLCFEADQQLEHPVSLLVRLAGGTCEGAEFVRADSHPDAGFVLRGPFELWKSILERKTLAATAIRRSTGRVCKAGHE